MLEKLKHYGIRGIVNEWFSSNLTSRTQTNQVWLEISDKAVKLSGVPQGSVLKPLLFPVYVNDMQNCSDKLKFYLFSDDTNLLYTDRKLKSFETVVNCELLSVYLVNCKQIIVQH